MREPEVVWHGPRSLTQVRQVCIPVKLLRALEIDSGGEVQFALDPDRKEIRVRKVPKTSREGGAK